LTTILLHTENRENLFRFFDYFNQSYKKNKFNILLHSKNYFPWEDEKLLSEITSFSSYYCYPTNKSKILSIIELIYKVKDEKFILVNEEDFSFSSDKNSSSNFNYLISSKDTILNKNLDTKYLSVKWFIIDVVSQLIGKVINHEDNSIDCVRYKQKTNSDVFFQKIIQLLSKVLKQLISHPLTSSGLETFV
jgi:hypothetical protein